MPVLAFPQVSLPVVSWARSEAGVDVIGTLSAALPMMGSGLDLTTLLAIVLFFLSASMGASGKSNFNFPSACSLGQIFLTRGTTSL